MTIVVGLKHEDGVILGADSQGSSGWHSRFRLDEKVFTAHGIGYGFTSSYRMGQILRYHTYEVLNNLRESDPFGYVVSCLVPMYRSVLKEHGYVQTENGKDSGGTFLLAFDGNLFGIQGDFQVEEVCEGYDAVGCGFAYALGSLKTTEEYDIPPEDRVRQAIETSCYFSNGCGGETSIILLDKDSE